MLTFAEERSGAITVIGVKGRVDSSTAKSLEERLAGMIQHGPSRVVVDCSNLDYISSAGCRALLVASKLAKKTGSQLALCGLTPDVLRVFELGGMTDFFAIYASREEGLAGLS